MVIPANFTRAPQTYDRGELVAICTEGIVPQNRWRNRDSAAAQRQLGEARALLAAGCDYRVLDGDNPARMRTDDQTIWIEISYRGFNDFEYGEGPSYDDTFYLPTRKRLASNRGSDWYR